MDYFTSVNIEKRKIYYISDLHVEFKDEKGFKDLTYDKYIDHVVRRMDNDAPLAEDPFSDAPLLIAGDISCYLSQVDYFFSQLRMRRDGLIIFVLGNHEIWNEDELSNRTLSHMIEEYRKVCKKYDIVLLQNELAFFSDKRTRKGEILPYLKKEIISENELITITHDKLKAYSKQAKLIVYGGIGFSGICETINKRGNIYNAELNLYRDVVPTLKEDIEESQKCECGYVKVLEALKDTNVIILTHSPFDHWSRLERTPNFIYVNGHTHHSCFTKTKKCTIFANNQVGYYSDDYILKYFYIDGVYDTFKDYKDGIYKITHNEYIDFNIGKNIKLQKKNDGKQIYLLKRSGFYMFVYYDASNKLILLNGGSPKSLTHDINFYYENLALYGRQLKAIMEKYTSALYSISCNVKKIGGNGTIHGCIVDIDYYNHIYLSVDGHAIPYYAINMNQIQKYKNLETLLMEKCPYLLSNFRKLINKETDSSMFMPLSFEVADMSKLVTARDMYKSSGIIRTIQYLLFQNVVRDWNNKIIYSLKNHSEDIYEEISKIQIDEKIFFKKK